ncbi:MAG: glutaredoxin family protein [Candidatus Diapherotrites archaeon]|nr:glutaredoxin family protein [Candidatus Diapherotrites archaeon]
MAKNVVVYSTTTCPYCVMAKDFLKEKKIKFEDVNLSENPARVHEIIEKSGQTGVPVIDVDGKIIVGFNKPELKKALGLN